MLTALSVPNLAVDRETSTVRGAPQERLSGRQVERARSAIPLRIELAQGQRQVARATAVELGDQADNPIPILVGHDARRQRPELRKRIILSHRTANPRQMLALNRSGAGFFHAYPAQPAERPPADASGRPATPLSSSSYRRAYGARLVHRRRRTRGIYVRWWVIPASVGRARVHPFPDDRGPGAMTRVRRNARCLDSCSAFIDPADSLDWWYSA